MSTTITPTTSRDTTTTTINGLDVALVRRLANTVAARPAAGMCAWEVTTRWAGGLSTDTRITGFMAGGQHVREDFTIRMDEPRGLGGAHAFANPQQHLMAAFNSCLIVGFTAQASLRGIQIEDLSIESAGALDLRGFLGLPGATRPGFNRIRYTIRVKADATRDQLEEIHRAVVATSPNRDMLANPVELEGRVEAM